MKTILLTTSAIAACMALAHAEDVATTNAPNFTLVESKEVAPSTNTPPDSLVENRNTPPRQVAAAAEPGDSTTSSSWRQSSDTPQPSTTHTSYRDRSFEVGAIFGEPTGASLKYWFNEQFAIDGALGWSFHPDDTDFYIHSDVLWHKYGVFNVSRGELPLYFGLGMSAKFRDHHDDIWGIRVPIGVTYLFDDCPVSIFAEVAPVLDVSPAVRGDFSVGVGARYRF